MLQKEPSWGKVRSNKRARSPLYLLALAIASVLVAAPLVSSVAPAQAAFAPSGSGLYKGSIDWLEWGTRGQAIPAVGKTVVSNRTIADQTLTTTCTLSGIGGGSGGLKAYASGDYEGDALDDLYFRGGTGKSNTLVYGLANGVLGQSVNFNVACSATLGKTGEANPPQVPLGGLVVADAESSNKSQDEYIQVTPNSAATTWRIIERSRSTDCTTNVIADLTASNKMLKLSPDGPQCRSQQPTVGNGPMAIAYMDGATGAAITVKGGGASAVAIGVVLQADFGDAPTSYGAAGALFQPSWSGGELTTLKTNVFTELATLGKPGQPNTRLGARTDSDTGYLPSANADADDTSGAVGVNDEDAISPLGNVSVVPGQAYTQNVACTGPGYVAGWIDWNANGVFDTGERSSPVACAGTGVATSVALNWTVPTSGLPTAQATKSFLRLRIATDLAGVASPTGMTTSGEVEDHPLQLSVPTLSIEKNISARAVSTDQFLLSLSKDSVVVGSATTTGSATGIQADKVKPVVVTPGSSYSFTEAMAPGATSGLSQYASNYSCTATYPDGSSQILSGPAQGTTGALTIPQIVTGQGSNQGAPAIKCVFHNAPGAATLVVNKTWVVNGATTTHGNQPKGLDAALALTHNGSTSEKQWGASTGGYVSGQKVSINEVTTIASAMPGCRVDSQKVTAVNGASTSAAVPFESTLKAGPNTVTLTNTLNCETNLTLLKDVRGGTAQPADWTLSAFAQQDAPVVSGTTGVTAKVAAAGKLQLAESAGSPLYVQDEERTAAETLAASRSTGSWQCVALDSDKATVNGVLGERAGLDGTVTPPLGSHVSCTAINRTAQLSLLKFVENHNGTGTATPSDFELTATPATGVTGLVPETVVGSSAVATTELANTVQVRPGHAYQLTEGGNTGGYVQVALQKFTGTNPDDAAQLANAANWVDVAADASVSVAADQHAVYRFVNRDAVRFALPLTGGSGVGSFAVVGGLVVALTVGAAILMARRRKASSTL